jgi:hypothetical protein
MLDEKATLMRFPVKTRINRGFSGNLTTDDSPYLTDGKVMIRSESVSAADRRRMRSRDDPYARQVSDKSCREIWREYTENRSHPRLHIFGVCQHRHATIPGDDTDLRLVLLGVDHTDLITVDADRMSYAWRVTGATDVEAGPVTGRDGYRPVILLRAGEPVAIVMPVKADFAVPDAVRERLRTRGGERMAE